jgi:hypothetical protein
VHDAFGADWSGARIAFADVTSAARSTGLARALLFLMCRTCENRKIVSLINERIAALRLVRSEHPFVVQISVRGGRRRRCRCTH